MKAAVACEANAGVGVDGMRLKMPLDISAEPCDNMEFFLHKQHLCGWSAGERPVALFVAHADKKMARMIESTYGCQV